MKTKMKVKFIANKFYFALLPAFNVIMWSSKKGANELYLDIRWLIFAIQINWE